MIDTKHPAGPKGPQAYLDAGNKAFNAGCDARLAGLPKSANPHPVTNSDSHHWSAWLSGWKDVDRYWGQQPQGRPVRPLPLVLPDLDYGEAG